MRKITCSIILCLSIFLFLINSAFAEDQVMEMEKPILQFPVISDVHIGGYGAQEKGFEHALKTYKQLAPNYQAIAIVGDLTQSGQPFEYDGFNQILNYFSHPSAEKIITMGNHEFFEGRYWPKPEHTEQYFIDRFIDKTKMPGLYYDKWIEGYHFIVLGGEESRMTNPSNGDDAIISDAQYNWLQEKLKENAGPNKPIFVFLHQAINGTVYGSDEWGSELEKLNDILSQYPQAILFTGHSHNLLNHPRTVYQNEFTMVNAGSVAYGWADGGYSLGLSQGLLVNVFENKVEIKTRDFTKNKWLDSYIIQIPFEKTIDDTIPPYFINEYVTVEDIKETQVKLTWNAALDNETLVDRYYINLDEKTLKTEYTEFWNPTTLPREISTILSNLESGTTYTMELVAVDAWKNPSKPVTFSFKTKDYNGWWFLDNTWYYFESNIKRQGWLFDDGYWYYLAPDGAMQTGWIEENGVEYYLDKSGAMQTGWLEIDKKRYYFNENGTKQTGWKYLNGTWYYLGQDGIMQTGWIEENGVKYYLDESGAMKNGWFETDKKWYYLSDNGTMQTGWKYVKGTWYYLGQDGIMQTGWIHVGGKWYLLDSTGAMRIGWIKDKEHWYYLDTNGVMQAGWLKNGADWYFLDSSGAMQTGWLKIGSDWYFFDSSGAMQTGWLKSGPYWYFLNSSGVMQTGWLKSGSDWYFLGTSGVMQTGWIFDNNAWYYLDMSGVWRSVS